MNPLEIIWENKLILGLTSVALALYFTRKYAAGGICQSKAKLNGKTVIVTGCNTGIGKETAKDLADRGARVIMACRNLEKANIAAEDIRKVTKNGSIRVMKLDLASFASVREFAEEFLNSEEHLDILINNAGLVQLKKCLTEDGNEMTFQSNHLGHFLLTNLLLHKMKESQAARIVNVSSDAHKIRHCPTGTLDLDDLNYEKRDYPEERFMLPYAASKLANILFTKELAKRLGPENNHVTTYTLHPGVIITEIWRDFSSIKIVYLFQILFYPIIKLCFKDSREGAQTTIYCAVEESLAGVTGKYYKDCQEVKTSHPLAEDEETAKKLWEISAKMVDLMH